ncbi:hypothetical protein E4663_14050 [Halobacillus salinus]|uniref:Type II toxin-antitoxin system RelE/ParE family toxin n=1 Tax=Halobacillus salinus TaxID=192814 RepID=A0A4Z0GYT9_9BACI|nr:hypothetical protein E4663_14050 [Halobacillus salinus]
MPFEIVYRGNVEDFEGLILYKAEQEVRIGKMGIWRQLADRYTRQLTIIQYDPYPDDEGVEEVGGEVPPSIKHLNANTVFSNFYRWGIKGRKTGDHRILYAIHNYSKVILLFYFDKQYNGSVKREDIVPAESIYEEYCIGDPNLYG